MSLEILNGSNAVWVWLVAGALLLSLEIVLPGAFLLWLGVAAVLVGLALPFLPISAGLQFALFAVLSVLLGAFARFVLRYGISVSDRSTLNKPGNRFTGQVVEVAEPIVNGRGKVKLGDTLWIAQGHDAAAGARVRVTGSKGTVLLTEPVP
jgi:membrane protein implicated in regulation of membrane protease activity